MDISGISTDQTEYTGKIILYSVQPRSKLAAKVADPALHYFWKLEVKIQELERLKMELWSGWPWTLTIKAFYP